jgi:hypothetical protein
MTRSLLAVLLALLTTALAGCHLSEYGHHYGPSRPPECDRWHHHEGSNTWHCHN